MPKKVVVYSTPTCPHCVTVKKYLQDKGISYTDLDVAQDQDAREEMMEKTGRMAVPVVMVDENVIVGFDKAKLDQLLS
ncbi:MAG: glutaredoxin domain-containing protein [Bacillota bacterium]|nr:NrdH-redoxin [Bacillota bacterium]HWR55728.1 glutaredoxin domain-containing protein [Negativicutes bacterium]